MIGKQKCFGRLVDCEQNQKMYAFIHEEGKECQLYVWQGYYGKVELISFKTFLARPVRRVALGAEHSLILTHDDHVFACGSNDHGQLGCPALAGEYSFDPCFVDSLSGQGITDIACGTNHSACVRKDGQIFLWGDNHNGQCGLNPSEHPTLTSPALVGLVTPGVKCKHGVTSLGTRERCVRIGAGTLHSLALSAEGNVWTWGKGPQLGHGDNCISSWVPTVVQKFCDKNVISITSGDFHNIVLVEETISDKKGTEITCDSQLAIVDISKTDCAKCKLEHNIVEEAIDENAIEIVVKQEEIKTDEDTKLDPSNNPKQKSQISVNANLAKEVDSNNSADVKDPNVDEQTKGGQTDIDEKANGDEQLKGENQTTTETSEIIDDGVELRKKKSNTEEVDYDPLTSSVRSDTSMTSSMSNKASRSVSFLDDTGAREFLARQFQEDDDVTPVTKPKPARCSPKEARSTATPDATPASPGAFMMQTMSSLTTMTSKALSNIVSVPGKFRFSTGGVDDEETKHSTDTSEVSDISQLEGGSTETINLDNSILDFSNLTVEDGSISASQLSLLESETSFSSAGSIEGSPVKQRKGKQPDRKSVSMESQSIRTIEARQENLRKRSLSLLTAEEGEEKDDVVMATHSLDTEVWCWGRNSKGQLGVGDMLDRSEPVCIQIMTGRRVVKVACGSLHTVAISSTGEVYSWGLNDSGQLGHNEMSSYAARIEITSDCNVWDIDAGSNHSIFLMDNSRTHETSPDVFYTGKHPCKDLYVPIFKTPRMSHLKFLKKAGWISSVVTGGDNCACVGRSDSNMTVTLFQLTRCARELHLQMYNTAQDLVKRIQISGYFKSLDTPPYKRIMEALLSTFTHLTKQFGVASVELSESLCRGDNMLNCSIFSQYEDYVTWLKKYSTSFEDMVAVGGFEFAAKSASSLFETLGQEVYASLLPGSKTEEKPDHAVKFRTIMIAPLNSVKTLSQIINKLADLYDKSSRENNLLSSVHLNLEHFLRTSKLAISDADNTNKFWESSSSKISDSLRSPYRRLIKESKSSPLSMVNAGRFSTHTFYLFNDIFIHLQYSSYQSYPLETVWIDTPSSESSTQQYIITVTTPEDVLSLHAQSAQVKTEWVVAFNTAINKVLASQKYVNRQNSGERVHTPVIRLASYGFTKHPLYRDAHYKGFWLNGKVHGTGMMKWQDGRRYKGKFKHGSITGAGKMLIPKESNTEEIQEGVWKDAKLHGHGKIRYSSGDLYDGFFKDGLRHGHGVYRKGRYMNSASFVYVGEWLYDKKHGYGVMDDILKGEKYMGMWQEDNRHGDGVVVTLDGMYFEGNFQYNKLVGHGLMLTDDNSCYEGEFMGITMLQGKGCLTFPSGDKIEGTFSGTWNQGLKLSGIFHKSAMTVSSTKHAWSRTSLETKTSLYGRLCVKPDRKWEEIFYQCYESLAYSGEGEPNTSKAWDQIVAAIMAGKQKLKGTDRGSMSSKQKRELLALEQLEKIPTHSAKRLSIEHCSVITQYLVKASETVAHPLGKLIDELVDVFRAAYIGIGAHPRLLHHAVQEIQSYMRRIYRVIRILFPELPSDGKPTHIFPEKSKRASTPISEDQGFLQRQVSETEEEDIDVETVSSTGILQPILMPKIYPALFDLYALHCDKDDDKYWERVQKLNKQGDMSLMAYLGIDQSYWCIDDALFKDKKTRISSIKDYSYSKAVEVLQQISTAFCPRDKLEVIQRTFLTITQTVQEYISDEHMWCMDDLFPIFQFVVIRSRIHHLGAEISYIEELMESYLEFGELGIMFTTMKACYFQIQNEKMPTH